MKAKQKELKKDGRGNKPKATTALSDEEIDILFERNVFETSSPQSLVNTAWLNNIIYFGLRGCTEQRNLRWGDVVLETDSQGKEYLVHSERQTKSRQGDDPWNVRPVKPRMYENKEIPAERNPVVYAITRCSILTESEPLQIFHSRTAERLYSVFGLKPNLWE